MRILALLPMLTAGLALACALWPAARRIIWPVVGLAAINVVLTPFTSGEWFYQHAEDRSYQQAVAQGDFASLDSLLGRHDPHLVGRMVVMAGCLLAALVALAVVKSRRGSALATGAVLLAAVATLIQGFLLVT
ncbi:MAG: hypothetical protein H6523_20210 [Mycolicibacterium sp.]|nr:hypothetical protein [Mycolicibacterium sp.]